MDTDNIRHGSLLPLLDNRLKARAFSIRELSYPVVFESPNSIVDILDLLFRYYLLPEKKKKPVSNETG